MREKDDAVIVSVILDINKPDLPELTKADLHFLSEIGLEAPVLEKLRGSTAYQSALYYDALQKLH